MISKSPSHLCNRVSVAAAKDKREDWKYVKEVFPDNNSSSSETLFWLFSLAWARDSPTHGAGPLPVTCQLRNLRREWGHLDVKHWCLVGAITPKGRNGTGKRELRWECGHSTPEEKMKGFQERKKRHGLIQVSWNFLNSWHLFPLTIAYYDPMLTISDGTWAKLQTYFQSLSIQPYGDGSKNCSNQAHAILFLISLLHGPTPPLASLGSVSLSLELYLFSWRAVRDLCLMERAS